MSGDGGGEEDMCVAIDWLLGVLFFGYHLTSDTLVLESRYCGGLVLC